MALTVLAGPAVTFEVGALLQGLTFFLSLGAMALVVYWTYRGTRLRTLEREAEGWQNLATLREAEVGDLMRRVTDLEGRITNLNSENDALRRLNLDLQEENFKLKTEVHRLQGKVELLEQRTQRDPNG